MYDAMEAAKLKAERTYNAAADTFDAQPLGSWNRYGRRTVERLGLRHGAHVLDVCCGSGASALPAAQAVGRSGTVIAVDLANDLLELGRAKARAAGQQAILDALAANGVSRVGTNVIYAVAERASGSA
jgi:ubiquinone/menaquinone biosynthesis C-methylase UbiE